MNISPAVKKFLLAFAIAFPGFVCALPAANEEAKLHKYSATLEKERPRLDDETKRLIAAYRRNPSGENFEALKKQVEKNYDKVLERKKAKLEELKKTARHASKVKEMQDIVCEMVENRDLRVGQTMSRFTDARLRPGARNARDGYLPILGAARNVFIAYAPVTNSEYAAFLKSKGKPVPESITGDAARLPVTNVSYGEAMEYCKWLEERDATCKYRLPSEAEWQLAAGHMPKDADFNCGIKNGLRPVDAYKNTISACGAIDMWGNCWEWTSTKGESSRGEAVIVKGGSYNSKRAECRTEHMAELRSPSGRYNDVGFRVVMEKSGATLSPGNL